MADRYGGRYGQVSSTTTVVDGVTRVRTHVPGPYGGGAEYEFTGPRDAVTSAVDDVLSRYPTAGYGTWFNWPPPPDGPLTHDGRPSPYHAPEEVSPGVWRAWGHHSNSCE